MWHSWLISICTIPAGVVENRHDGQSLTAVASPVAGLN